MFRPISGAALRGCWLRHRYSPCCCPCRAGVVLQVAPGESSPGISLSARALHLKNGTVHSHELLRQGGGLWCCGRGNRARGQRSSASGVIPHGLSKSPLKLLPSPGRHLVYRGGGRTELAKESEVNGTRFGPESKARRAAGMGQDFNPLLRMTCSPSPAHLEHLGSLLKHLVGSPISCGRTTTVFYGK